MVEGGVLDMGSDSVGWAGALGDVGGERGEVGELRTVAPLRSSLIGLSGSRGEEGGELRASSLESFFRNILVKNEVRLSRFLGSTAFSFLSSGLDEGDVIGLSVGCVGCGVGMGGVGVGRCGSGVFAPSSSEPVSVVEGGGVTGRGMSEVEGVGGATGEVGVEVSLASTELELTKLLAVVRLKSSDFTCCSAATEVSEREVVKWGCSEFEPTFELRE